VKIELRAVKISKALSRETIAFTGTLYIDGRKAAYCMNDGGGADNTVDFVGGWDGEFFKAMQEHIATLPPVRPKWLKAEEKPLRVTLDWFISDLVGKAETEQAIKRWCRRNVVYRIKGDPEGEYRQWGLRGGRAGMTIEQRREVTQIVRDKHGDSIIEIHGNYPR
jgi:hypothetical protein